MATLLTLLEQAPFITWLRGNLLGYVVLNAAHVLALGIFMGAVVSLDLGILRAPGFGWSATVAGPLRRMAIAALLCAVLTGALLFSVRPTDYLDNGAFLAKLALLLLSGTNALLFQLVESATVRVVQAGLSLILWIGVLLAGRLIGFV
uniref:hypothetical protein n=1 Tax=uncultured Acidovorax sp. TaxID=158751 RepID=UPI00076A6CB1|nr:hypothetical protein [uncultured Acidovorax sp.]